MDRGQDSRLMPMIVETMAQAGIAFTDLDRIAVACGPGSFTGVRVGLASARGIGLAANKPVLGIDRFAIYKLLHAAPEKNLLVVIDSKRAELFCQYFPASGLPEAPGMLTSEQIQTFLAAHPNTDVSGDKANPDADILSACAQLAAEADPQSSAFLPRPLYLRPPDVTLAAKKS